jgi:hypothetical protein
LFAIRLLLTNGAFAHLPDAESIESLVKSFTNKQGPIGQPLIAAQDEKGNHVYVVREHVVAVLGEPTGVA